MENLSKFVELNESGWYWPISDDKGERGNWHQLKNSYGDSPQKIANSCENKRVLVQAGGNCGLYVKEFANLFKHVYTFEPDPVNFYCLNLNVTESNVYKFQAALGSERKLVSIVNDISYNVGATHVSADVSAVGHVPILRIDDLGLNVCDAIQLDIEGYELFALYGAEETIKKCRPTIILESCWTHRYSYDVSAIYKFLENLGYKNFGELPHTQNDVLFKPVN